MLLLCFDFKKSAADHAPSIKTCKNTRSSPFEVAILSHWQGIRGETVKFENTEVQGLLNPDLRCTQGKLSETLELTKQAISNHFEVMTMAQKTRKLGPVQTLPKNVEHHFFTCKQLLQKQNQRSFCIELYWRTKIKILYDHLKQSRSWIRWQNHVVMEIS